MKENIIYQLEKYKPWNEQEAKDKEIIISMLNMHSDLYERSNLIAHMTASAWVINQTYTKVLMAYHKLYKSWAWLGGHADGNKNLLDVALKEVKEESGLENIYPLSEEIYSLEVLAVNGHEKKNVYIPSHLHLNITYIIGANDKDKLRINEAENTAIAWFEREEAIKMSTEPWLQKRIYRKLNDQIDIVLKNR